MKWQDLSRKIKKRLAYFRSESAEFVRHSLAALVLGWLCAFRRRSSKTEWHQPRILVIRIDGLGDFVLTTPFLRELRQLFPGSHITLLTGANVGDLALPCPYVDRVEMISSTKRKIRNLPEFIKFANGKLYSNFDVVLLPRWDIDYYWATLLACLSAAPRVVAYTRKTTVRKAFINWGYDSLVTDLLPKGDIPHERDRSLEIVNYLGGQIRSRSMELWWSASDEAVADCFIDSLGNSPPTGYWVAVGIGASNERKQWPYFNELLAMLVAKMSISPLIFVAPNELQLANELKEKVPECIIVCQPLRTAAVLMSRCSIFVGNDSGPLHMAAAVGLPTVEICCHPENGDPANEYSPLRFGHLGDRGRVLQPASGLDNCSACCIENHAHCISLVKPPHVVSAIESLAAIKAGQVSA